MSTSEVRFGVIGTDTGRRNPGRRDVEPVRHYLQSSQESRACIGEVEESVDLSRTRCAFGCVVPDGCVVPGAVVERRGTSRVRAPLESLPSVRLHAERDLAQIADASQRHPDPIGNQPILPDLSTMMDCRRRRVTAPVLAVGDAVLGFWKIREVFPATREQRCWFHKQANVLRRSEFSSSSLVNGDRGHLQRRGHPQVPNTGSI